MSYAETPAATVGRFSRTWGVTGRQSLVSELVSVSKETNREPDSYYFLVENDVLVDPNTGKPVLDFISEGTEKELARDLQNWASRTDEGMAMWVSAKSRIYPCPKTIMHRIAYTWEGQKVVLNSAILFDGEIENSEYKRRTLYCFPDSDEAVSKIIRFIERKSGQQVILRPSDHTSREKAEMYANLIKSGIPPQIIIFDMQRSGFLGQNSISCPVIGIAIALENKFVEHCGKCGKEIKKKISKGYRCECGGVYEGC